MGVTEPLRAPGGRAESLERLSSRMRSQGKVSALKKKLVIWGLVGLSAAGAGIAYGLFGRKNAPEVQYDTSTIERGTVVAKVTATGTLSALVTVQVGSQVSGRLKEILVDFNSNVTKGQVIARIDAQLFEAALEQAKANFVAASANELKAKVQAEEAERQLARSAELAERKLISQADLDTAKASRDAARAQVQAAAAAVAQTRAALHQAEINLAYTTIVSPINGVVISRNVDVGQTVAASLQAPTLFVIAEDLRKMQVDTSVSEADIGKLRAGMDATFVVDAYPGKSFAGTVRQIRNAAQTIQNVVTYDAVIDVANPELELRPGMTANVTFVYARVEDVVRVPNAALRFRPSPEQIASMSGEPSSGGSRGRGSPPEKGVAAAEKGVRSTDPSEKNVWVLAAGTPRRVSLKVGISDGSATQVVSGELEPGATVITGIKSGGPSGGSKPGTPMRMF